MGSSRSSAMFAGSRTSLPRGGALPDRVWLARHRGICALLWFHVVALVIVAVLRDQSLLACVLGPAIVAALTVAAMWEGFSHNTRASLATLGLLSCSAILIQYYDGLIEAHFHFFITIAVVSLYQSWRPYLIGVGYVLLHHLVLGTLMPHAVYNHHMATDHPWLFALVHGGAIFAESVACLVFWRVNEEALDAEKENRKALERANGELTRANRAVEDLVGMLSHDLRVPLTVLIGYSEMALESWSEMADDDQIDFVHKVSKVGRSLTAVLEDTLTVSAIDAQGVVPRRVPVRVDESVREAVALLPEPFPQVDLSRLEPATAEVDRRHLEQVLHNLLTNAVKYGAGGFSIASHEEATDVVISIADSGPGVPPEFVPHLFERFTRSEAARVGREKGTGLGLYITQSLLVENAGSIAYLPTEGGGATFRLRLRRALPPRDDGDDGREHPGLPAPQTLAPA